MPDTLLARPLLALIRGAGDLATGVAVRLYRAGFLVVMTELERPLAVRRTVAFAQAVYDNAATVEGVTARCVPLREAGAVLASREIPVVVDPDGTSLTLLHPDVLVDARLAKRNLSTRPDDATLVIGLGPGFTAGVDCHAVIETNRGHNLGRVLWNGAAEPNTGVPGRIGGVDAARVLRAPADGEVIPLRRIGDVVAAGDVVARVGGVDVVAGVGGILRGMVHGGLRVSAGTKLGDVDPRAEPAHVHTISDKSRAIAGGVLEAILSAPQLRLPS
ncbi:MAG: selenium-dependent molybdenum cofactor biosynthesis protein YqeB [Anaerolineae bacterium]